MPQVVATENESPTPHIASDSQRAAIEADLSPVLVLAGPGAGKTFCLIERIRFLIEKKGIDPARICAFTFTNKAAGEISHRLEKFLGPRANDIRRGTIHSFCADLLREYPEHADIKPGFGIATEDYQHTVLRRMGIPEKWRSGLLKEFTALRFISGYQMKGRDYDRYTRYLDFLKARNLVDFDMLIMKAADLLRHDEVWTLICAKWDAVLVDEFQDLTPTQYTIIRALAKDHRNIFAVGDDEQSIYSWAGASPQVFRTFLNDFSLIKPTTELAENRRCPREVMELARRIINYNTPIFEHRAHAESEKPCEFPIRALEFASGEEELRWIISDILEDRTAHGMSWGSYALLSRTNDMGNTAESLFLTADIPCRMASGRSLSDHPVIRCVIEALRVIGNPDDPAAKELYLEEILPRTLFDRVVRKAEEKKREILPHLEHTLRNLAREDEDAVKLKRAISALKSLESLGTRHQSLDSLVNELLSKRVGMRTSFLEDNHDELSDPASNGEVEMLAAKLDDAIRNRRTIWIRRMNGAEVGIKGMLVQFGAARVQIGGTPPAEAVGIGEADCKSLGIALGVFKALQLIRSRDFANPLRTFTAIDLETTDKDTDRAELVQIAAVRVRNGRIVDRYMSYVKPDGPISPGAFDTHHISEHDVADAPSFAEMWPHFCEFCGTDLLVAHNGHGFDFRILQRIVGPEFRKFPIFDSLAQAEELRTGSLSLQNLARAYGVHQSKAHDALDDTEVLAQVAFLLGEEKVVRSRKTCLEDLLHYLGISLALADRETLCIEAERLRDLSRFYSLGKYTPCLDFYADECALCDDAVLPDVAQLVALLGGEALRDRIRADKTADDRYPDVMDRLRPLISFQPQAALADQIRAFLERITLSKWDGVDIDAERVNLLTLHSTKGLEFSRVYIVGTDDKAFTRSDKRSVEETEELRRLLYVGMTRTIDRLVLTCAQSRGGEDCGGHKMLDELGITPTMIS